MKYFIYTLLAYGLFAGTVSGQTKTKSVQATTSHDTLTYKTPSEVWGRLFSDVQSSKIFADNKFFVDAVPRFSPSTILAKYNQAKIRSGDTAGLGRFVRANFILPVAAIDTATSSSTDIIQHIESLWPLLTRKADAKQKGGTLISLPYPYVVPGGRFREVYYWDSYFTMLGLAVSNRYDLIENMLDNFKYLIDNYGHIPNGNRTYYLSRSQPPFFALMVELLHEKAGDRVYKKYLSAMQKEYTWWMQGEASLKPGEAYKRVVKLSDSSILNRYWDDKTTPREESYSLDINTAANSRQKKEKTYLNIRAAAESGWDFSSRWFRDTFHLNTIATTDIIPVDLNCLLYAYETILHRAVQVVLPQQRNIYHELSENRRKAIIKTFWNDSCHYYFDYDLSTQKTTNRWSAAGLYPLFVEAVPKPHAEYVKYFVTETFLKPGGITTTPYKTGEQWDAPNGWAPIQYIAVKGLQNYKYDSLAAQIATRWMSVNENVYKSTGKLVEKYNIEDTTLPGGGGEYPTQDGFGWTNGVYLKFTEMFRKQ